MLSLKSLHYSWADKNSYLEYMPKNKKYIRKISKKNMKIPCTSANSMTILSNGDITSCCYDISGDNKYKNVLSEGVVNTRLNSKKYLNNIYYKRFKLCKKCPVPAPSATVLRKNDLAKLAN